MCACEPSFTCSRCRDTRLDPLYLLSDPEQGDPYNLEPELDRPAELEVLDG